MAKQREPVIYQIQGTSYEVDIEEQVLRQTNDREKTISFVEDMEDCKTHYRLMYDPANQMIGAIGFEWDETKYIDVPQMTALDPEGMAAKYGRSLEEVRNLSDLDLMTDQEALAIRHHGVLPQIDIAGERFIVDVRMMELRHVANLAPIVSLNDLNIVRGGLEADYDPMLKMPVKLDPNMTEFPDHVVRIRIPFIWGLDPVGSANLYKMAEREVLRRHPIQKELKAEVIPLSETEVPGIIRQNREKLQQEHQENAQKVKPRRRLRL